MEAIRFIVDTLLWLLTLAFVLRLLFQWVRADFRDPMADAIVRVTNWLILPLRRRAAADRQDRHRDRAWRCSWPPRSTPRRCSRSSASPLADPLLFARVTLIELADMMLRIYLFALLLYWVTSSSRPGGYAPGVRLLAQLCEPILKRVRRVIPPIGQIDFSFLWVSIAIGALLDTAAALLMRPALNMHSYMPENTANDGRSRLAALALTGAEA